MTDDITPEEEKQFVDLVREMHAMIDIPLHEKLVAVLGAHMNNPGGITTAAYLSTMCFTMGTLLDQEREPGDAGRENAMQMAGNCADFIVAVTAGLSGILPKED